MRWLKLGCVMCLVACSGSSTRHFEAQDGGGGSGGANAGTGGTAQSGGTAGTGGASSGGGAGKGGSSGLGGSGGNATSGAAGALATGGTGGAAGGAGAPPMGCSGPPRCSVAGASASCQAIRGCFWTQCTQRNEGFVYGCGTEGKDAAGNCPPGCTLDVGSGNCVGGGDYYGPALPCGDAARQTQDTCVGVGFLWQSCSWQTAVGCYGTPTRQDCTGLPDEITCIQEGCTWN